MAHMQNALCPLKGSLLCWQGCQQRRPVSAQANFCIRYICYGTPCSYFGRLLVCLLELLMVLWDACAGPGGVLGAAEGLTYLSLAAGAVILTLQVSWAALTCHAVLFKLSFCERPLQYPHLNPLGCPPNAEPALLLIRPHQCGQL